MINKLVVAKHYLLLAVLALAVIGLIISLSLIKRPQKLLPEAEFGSVSLAVDPDQGTFTSDQQFEVALKIDAGDFRITSANVEVTYDQNYLEVEELIPNEQVLPTMLVNDIATVGVVKYAALRISAEITDFPTDSFTLATIRFKSKTQTPQDSTSITYFGKEITGISDDPIDKRLSSDPVTGNYIIENPPSEAFWLSFGPRGTSEESWSSASKLLDFLADADKTPLSIYRYLNQASNWEPYLRESGVGVDFNITPGTGYMIKFQTDPGSFEDILEYTPVNEIIYDMGVGMNLISLSTLISSQQLSTAEDLCQFINSQGVTVDKISNHTNQANFDEENWTVHLCSSENNNFNLSPDRAYFVNALSTGSWSLPGLPSDCPLHQQGDADCDGEIGGADYIIWSRGSCPPAAYRSVEQLCADLRADFDTDGDVDNDDYYIWADCRRDPEVDTVPEVCRQHL